MTEEQSKGYRGCPTGLHFAQHEPFNKRETIFSDDRVYRYVLWREWNNLFDSSTGHAMFIGLNPSTADETKNDPTIRKCIGFAKRWGYNAMCMTNLFAFRSTDPRKMMGFSKPIGPDNDMWIARCAREAGTIVAAWGVKGQHIDRDLEVRKLIDRLQCLRRTKRGFPEHPLYVPYDATLKDFDL